MTETAAVIGYPVKHALSPAMHSAAYKELGIDWRYVAVEIEPGDVIDVENEIRSLLLDNGYKALNITMPHKEAAFAASDEVYGAAKRLGTVNTIVRDGEGLLHGYSTDGDGFINGLYANNIDVNSHRVLVIGAGSASKAICDALYSAGAHVLVAARNEGKSKELCDLILQVPSENGGDIHAVEFSARASYADGCRVIVNATPIGMADTENTYQVPIDVSVINENHIVVDTIYHPKETLLLKGAKENGAVTFNGIPMLLGQGALAFQLMTGLQAPVEVMSEALMQELDRRK